MAVALAIVGGMYLLALGLLAFGAFSTARTHDVRGVFACVMFLVLLPAVLWSHYTHSGSLALRAAGVRTERDEVEGPFAELVHKLAAQADIQAPQVFVAHPKA